MCITPQSINVAVLTRILQPDAPPKKPRLTPEQQRLVTDNLWAVHWFVRKRLSPEVRDLLGVDECDSVGYLVACQIALRCGDIHPMRFRAYVWKSLRNRIWDWIVPKCRRAGIPVGAGQMGEDDLPHDVLASLPSREPDPAELTCSNAFVEALFEAVFPWLTRRQREILPLLLEGLDQVQIAERLGVHKSMISDYVGQLRQRFVEAWARIIPPDLRPVPRCPA